MQAGKQLVDDFDAMVAGAAVDQDGVELGHTIRGWTAQHQPDTAPGLRVAWETSMSRAYPETGRTGSGNAGRLRGSVAAVV